MATLRTKKPRVKISFSQAIDLLVPYVKKRIGDQLGPVSLIALYLLFFQVVILRVPVAQAGVIVVGLILVVVGLAFFIEGLFIGIMPLGEAIGVQLPQKSRAPLILVFAFILGIGATFAEPTIGFLRAAGRFVEPWNAPLLFTLLNRHASWLVLAVGTGVGIAVMLGMLRFLFNWPFKVVIIGSLVLVIGTSLSALFEPNMRHVLSMAWDCGGITTGPVTVPLVLALGIGICRVVGSASSGIAGFGIVALAALYPVLTVLVLSWGLAGKTLPPTTDVAFALPENRARAAALFESEERMIGYVLMRGSNAAQQALFGNDGEQRRAYLERCVTDHALRQSVFGPTVTAATVTAIAAGSGNRDSPAAALLRERAPPEKRGMAGMASIIMADAGLAARAILPLNLFLVFVLVVVLRERIVRGDEIFTGVTFALIGLGLFNIGMEFGLARLGQQVGNTLPATFTTIELAEHARAIEPFDTSLVTTAITENGGRERFFFTRHGERFLQIPFFEHRYDASAQRYWFVPRRGPIDGKEDSVVGMIVVLAFAFIMGYGASLAEPALRTLGFKVEELTVGVFKMNHLRHSAAIGVGFGMMLGLAKIMFDLPLFWLLIPSYAIAVILTLLTEDDFVNIAWDSGGFCSGPVTVPLVLAMGLGIGSGLAMPEGFGIIALASVWPICSVMTVGMLKARKRRAAIEKLSDERVEGAQS